MYEYLYFLKYINEKTRNLSALQKILCAAQIVYNNIEYMEDYRRWQIDDFWQTPFQTLALRTGDCEDMAWLLCKILNNLGFLAHITIGDIDTYNGLQGHAWVTIPTLWGIITVEATNGKVYPGLPPEYLPKQQVSL